MSVRSAREGENLLIEIALALLGVLAIGNGDYSDVRLRRLSVRPNDGAGPRPRVTAFLALGGLQAGQKG